MITVFLVGAAVGLGIHLLAQGLFPPKPTLAQRVRTLLEPAPARAADEPEARRGLQARVERHLGGPLVGLFATAGADPSSRSRQQDLRVTGVRIESLMAEKAMLGVTGVAFPLVVAAGLGVGVGVGGTHPPLPIVVGASVLLGAIGFIAPDTILRKRAAARRKSFRQALSAFLDLVAISLAGGGLVQGSMQGCGLGGTGLGLRRVPPPARDHPHQRAPGHEPGAGRVLKGP